MCWTCFFSFHQTHYCIHKSHCMRLLRSMLIKLSQLQVWHLQVLQPSQNSQGILSSQIFILHQPRVTTNWLENCWNLMGNTIRSHPPRNSFSKNASSLKRLSKTPSLPMITKSPWNIGNDASWKKGVLKVRWWPGMKVSAKIDFHDFWRTQLRSRCYTQTAFVDM